jgi:Tol biopolymer transport system component
VRCDRVRRILKLGSGALCAFALAAPASALAQTELVTVSADGEPANGISLEPTVSGTALVAWTSEASNLVPGDENGFADVFARRLPSGPTRLLSGLPGGGTGAGPSTEPDITANGRFVAFTSLAALLPADTNGTADVYVRDLATGRIDLVSVNSRGVQGNDFSYVPSISDNGRWVAFGSGATNLAPGGNEGFFQGLYVRDRKRGTTTRITTLDSTPFPELAADAPVLAFVSEQPVVPGGGPFDVYLADLRTGTFELVSEIAGSPATAGNHSIDAGGEHVTFTTGNFPEFHVYVWSRRTRATEQVDVSSSGESANNFSDFSSIDAKGRRVAFVSIADNLVPGDTNNTFDIFVRDRRRGTTQRASVSTAGGQADMGSNPPALSPDGRLVAFSSEATNLVPGDTNGLADIFVRRLLRP